MSVKALLTVDLAGAWIPLRIILAEIVGQLVTGLIAYRLLESAQRHSNNTPQSRSRTLKPWSIWIRPRSNIMAQYTAESIAHVRLLVFRPDMPHVARS